MEFTLSILDNARSNALFPSEGIFTLNTALSKGFIFAPVIVPILV